MKKIAIRLKQIDLKLSLYLYFDLIITITRIPSLRSSCENERCFTAVPTFHPGQSKESRFDFTGGNGGDNFNKVR